MSKKYRMVIRILCILVLMLAVGIVLVRKGVIPRFRGNGISAATTENALAAEDIVTIELPQAADQEVRKEETSAEETTKEEEDLSEENAEAVEPIEESTEEVAGESEEEPSTDDTGEASALLEAYLKEDPRTPVEAKGIFVTGAIAGTKNTMPELIKLTEQTELNTMIIDIKNDAGEITYKVDLPLAQEIGADIRYVADMPALIQDLKDRGIYVVARIVAFKDPILAENKPEYAVKNRDGSVFHDNHDLAWVNPYNEAVWDYLIDVSKKAVELGFDEIQYDYIRFSTAEGIADADFGKESEGKTRQEAINGFLTRAYETLAPMGVYVSVDVFGTIICNESDGRLIGQDYVEMAKHCDYICPMVYPSHYVDNAYGIKVPDAKPYDLIKAAVADGEAKLSEAAEKDQLAHIAKQRPWLQAFTASWVNGHINYGGQQLKDQVRGAKDAGVDEWLLWNASNNYDRVKSGLKR